MDVHISGLKKDLNPACALSKQLSHFANAQGHFLLILV